eukprot:3231226-Alexandrium_andersonii.AAC.1
MQQHAWNCGSAAWDVTNRYVTTQHEGTCRLLSGGKRLPWYVFLQRLKVALNAIVTETSAPRGPNHGWNLRRTRGPPPR